MVATAPAVFYIVAITEAVVALRAMLLIHVATFAEATHVTDGHVTRTTFIAMIGVIIQMQFTKSMLPATGHVCILTTYFKREVTFLTFISMTVGTMFFNQ